MDIDDIIELNNNFYKLNATDFSKTRKSYWPGWNRLLRYINKENSEMLDLGCGNGRLFSFLSENLQIKFNYTGIDNNEYLLTKAKETAPSANFINLDIFKKVHEICGKYDYIFIFGVMHHIPNAAFREEWFIKMANNLNEKGTVFLTTWNINNDLRADKLIKLEIGDNNDFLYGWADTNTHRYVHTYTENEIESLVKSTKKLKIVNKFSADGRNNKLNSYYILGTI